MKFGANMLLYGDAVDAAAMDRFAQLRDMGLDVVEIPVLDPDATDVDTVRAAAERNGLGITTSGIIPGGTKDNRSYVASSVQYDPKITETRQVLLNDAQTSGGLLIALPRDRAENMGTIIGEVVSCPDATIIVRE